MLGGALRAHVRRTVHQCGRRSRLGSAGGVTSYTLAASVQAWTRRRRAAASVEDRSRQSYRLHSHGGGSGGGLETSCSGAGGGPEPADIEGAHSWSHRPAAAGGGQSSDSESRSLRIAGLGQRPGPRHSPALTRVRRGTSDGHGWIRSKAVEITGSRVGRAAIQDVPLREFLVCAVEALALTPRDLISHRFTLSLYKKLSREQRYQSPIQLQWMIA